MYKNSLSSGNSALSQFNFFPNFGLSGSYYTAENQTAEANAHIESLVARAKNGEQAAFSLLYEEFVSNIYRYIYLRIGRVEQTEDLTQEVFLKALHNIHSYHFKGKSFASWLFRIAHNLVIDQYRQSGRNVSSHLIEPLIESADNDPEATVEQNQEISNLRQAIENLPSREKEIILLRFVAELSIAETAQVSGTTEGNVKKLQHEAISKLRRQMQKSEQGTEIKIKGLILDYDGTISSLNVSRQLSRVPSHLEVILKMIREFIPIGIITIKDLPFILPRTSFAHAWGAIAGLEMKTGSQLIVSSQVRKALPALNQALLYAKQNITNGGLIEEKCDYTGQPLAFCVDWRQVENQKEAMLMSKPILKYCRELGLKVVKYPGKPYFDVFSCSINKGKALKRIKHNLNLSGNILYMGDSITDNAAFRESDVSIGVTAGKKPLDLDCQYWIKFEDVPYFLNFLREKDFIFNPGLPGIRLMG